MRKYLPTFFIYVYPTKKVVGDIEECRLEETRVVCRGTNDYTGAILTRIDVESYRRYYSEANWRTHYRVIKNLMDKGYELDKKHLPDLILFAQFSLP